MRHIAAMRLTAPEILNGEIKRQELIQGILERGRRIIYVQGGSGYGKTTFLSQLARTITGTRQRESDQETAGFIWLTLDGENEIFQFLASLSAAVRRVYPDYDFQYADYLLLEGKSNFLTLLADELIESLDQMAGQAGPLLIVLDDLHSVTSKEVQDLIARLLKYLPSTLCICLGSREGIWAQLSPLVLQGRLEEVTQRELAFTREETDAVMGVSDPTVYEFTEGWPFAVRSCKLLRAEGITVPDHRYWTGHNFYSIPFHECIRSLPSATIDFLQVTSCFDDLDPAMINAVLQILHSEHILETLVSRNLFTTRSANGHYRYHALFREFLDAELDPHEKKRLQRLAAIFYQQTCEYYKAASYALKLSDAGLLSEILLLSYRDLIRQGDFSTLSLWFQSLESWDPNLTPPLLIAKGALLSSMGRFLEASSCLDKAIPFLTSLKPDKEGENLYLEAMIHKARVLRNSDSFDASNEVLDQLLPLLADWSTETAYSVVIEKVYNLCWGSRIREAFDLIGSAIEVCSRTGNQKVRAWYQRYLSVLYFFSGNMRRSVEQYESSRTISEEERRFLDLHSIGFCVAKAYQMMGQRERSLMLVNEEISRIRSAGLYEELSMAYLFIAEIYYQNAFLDQMNGIPQNFETTIHYFELANEYAPLYRTSEFQLRWARIHQLTYSLIFTKGPQEEIIQSIFASLAYIEDYFKTTTLARLFSYFGSIGDFPNAVKCAQQCIQIGEKADLMLLPVLAYGILARAALTHLQGAKQGGQSGTEDFVPRFLNPAIEIVRRYLLLCAKNGIYEYFILRVAYDPMLEFAQEQGIEPEITAEIMVFCGYHKKKVAIETFGGLMVREIGGEGRPLKMRSKKVRELLAFLLYAGESGATKEQIRYALWSESESEDVKKLIGVTLSHLKADLSRLGIENPLTKKGDHYSIDRTELQVDTDQFRLEAQEYQKKKTEALAQKILALHKGEYLPEFHSLWVLGNRIRYRTVYEDALQYKN